MSIAERMIQGEKLFNEGLIDPAEKCFLEIILDDPGNAEAFNNLAVISNSKNNTREAIDYLIRSLQIDPFQKDAVVNCAEIATAIGQPDIARPVIERYLSKFPDDSEIGRYVTDSTDSDPERPRLAVLCLPGLESFLGDIVQHLRTKYIVRTYYEEQPDILREAILWADIVWLEWGNEITSVLTTQVPELEQKHVICRLHSYEAFSGFVHQTNWNRVDDLIFVSATIRDHILSQLPEIKNRVGKIHLMPNGIDLDKFKYTKRSKGYNLAFVGDINYKKGPMLLFHAFAELARKDPKYTLSIAGRIQDDRYALYFRQLSELLGLKDRIRFDGWVDDISAWLEDKQYIVCTSLLEGHPVGLMEGMARGLKPIIHNFVGARKIYPNHFIWNSIDQFVAMVSSDEYDSRAYRDWVEQNCSLEIQLDRLDEIFDGIEVSTHEQAAI